jgi:hypothetical protein
MAVGCSAPQMDKGSRRGFAIGWIVTRLHPDRHILRLTADLSLGDDDLGPGEVYDVVFDSETRFHLNVDGPGRHVQIPYDIIPPPLGFQ